MKLKLTKSTVCKNRPRSGSNTSREESHQNAYS